MIGCADDMQPPEFRGAGSEFNVGASTSHVRGDCDVAQFARSCDDRGLLGVPMGIQHGMRDTGSGESLGEQFRFLNRACANQNGAPTTVNLFDFGSNRLPFRVSRTENAIRQSLSPNFPIGGNDPSI